MRFMSAAAQTIAILFAWPFILLKVCLMTSYGVASLILDVWND